MNKRWRLHRPKSAGHRNLRFENLESRDLLSAGGIVPARLDEVAGPAVASAATAFVWRLVDTQVDPSRTSQRLDYGALGWEELNFTKDAATYRRVVNDYGQDYVVNWGFQHQLPQDIKPNTQIQFTVNVSIAGVELRDLGQYAYRGYVGMWTHNGYVPPQLDHPIVGVDKSHPSESVTFTFTTPTTGDKFTITESVDGGMSSVFWSTVMWYSFQKFAVAPVKRPTAAQVTARPISTSEVELSWKKVANAESYDVWKSDGGKKTFLGNVSGTMFVVGGLTPGVVSRYSVVARNSAGTAASPWVACAPARAVLKDNALVIFGTHKGDNIVVGQTNDRIAIKNLRILYNGKLEKDVYSGLVGEIRVYGGRANDTIELDTGKQPIYARAEVEGGPGNDTISGVQGGSNLIHGGEDNDRITGGNNDDKLYGESGDDQLFGLNGNDQLYGDYGNDWLEAGSVQEVADFGPNPYGLDKDYNAHQWAISGATYDDIRQGRIGNCSFLAALSSLALRGVDLESRIRYLGDFIYEVKLYDLKGHLAPQRVRFNGFGNNRDPEPAAAGEFWTVLYRRAFLKVYGAIDDGLPLTQPLTVLTGKPSTFRPLKDTDPAANASVFNEMEEAIRAARNVTTATPAKGFLTVELVYKHAYTVVSVQRDPAGQPESVVVRNPWGRDGGSAPSGNPDDGLIALSWDVFQRDMAGVCIN